MATNANKADTVKVKLPRSFMWTREGAKKPDRYGPGVTEIPREMAEGLVKAGVLEADALGKNALPADESQPGALSDLTEQVATLEERVRALEEMVVSLMEKSVGPTMDYSGLNITDDAFAFAMENNLDPGSITGTGKDGRILKADVEAALKAK